MSSKKTFYLSTTEVPTDRTVFEITGELVKAGAVQIANDYKDGRITGLRWIMKVPGRGDVVFDMPARVEPVHKILAARGTSRDPAKLRLQAERTAWRLLLRWVQAQTAMIQTQMIDPAEAFFPYLQTPSGETIYRLFRGGGLRELAAPKEPQP